jgi:uncharacterized lipoprotein YddW (UPF0748 family)
VKSRLQGLTGGIPKRYHYDMKTRMLLLFCFCLALCLNTAYRSVADVRPELRAFWADGFNAAIKTPQQVDELLQRLHDTHCNAIFAQVRKGGDAYYASHYEPWAKDDQTHFDALAYLIAHAHAMTPRIAVHAWINTCAVGGNGTNPFNIVALHPDWLSMNPEGKDFDGEATKIDPGQPGAADWTFRIYLDVARHYDVDGIHFDFVRYGGKEWGYNPVSVARFQEQWGGRSGIKRIEGSELPDPTDELWQQWRRDQVTNIVRKVYVHAAQVNPKVVVSAAVITWGDGPHTDEDWFTKSAAMHRTMQDWRGWLQEGMIDLACPMTYFQADNHTDWQRNWSEYIKNHQYHRAATVAVGTWFNTIPQNLELIEICRAKSAKGKLPYGVMLYSYAGTNASVEKDAKGKRQELEYQPDFYAALSRASAHPAPFPTDAPLPPMPWKETPRTGIVKGYLLTPNLDPIDGATVTVRGHGKNITRLADGTGFFAFVDLPAGEYTLRVTAKGYERQQIKATVAAGKVTTQQFTLGSPAIPLTPSLAALQGATAAVNGTPVRLQNLLVVLGSDTFPGNLYVQDGHGLSLRVRLAAPPPMPFQPGDIVAVNGTLLTVDNEPTIDRAIVRQTDIALSTDLPAPVSYQKVRSTGSTYTTGILFDLTGKVVDKSADGFIVESEGTRILVPTAGRKTFGVEATTFPLPTFDIGANVALSGLLVSTSNKTGKPTSLLRLMEPDSFKLLPPTTFWQNPTVRGVALAGFFRPLGDRSGNTPQQEAKP